MWPASSSFARRPEPRPSSSGFVRTRVRSSARLTRCLPFRVRLPTADVPGGHLRLSRTGPDLPRRLVAGDPRVLAARCGTRGDPRHRSGAGRGLRPSRLTAPKARTRLVAVPPSGARASSLATSSPWRRSGYGPSPCVLHRDGIRRVHLSGVRRSPNAPFVHSTGEEPVLEVGRAEGARAPRRRPRLEVHPLLRRGVRYRHFPYQPHAASSRVAAP